jgi:hypothetical protein
MGPPGARPTLLPDRPVTGYRFHVRTDADPGIWHRATTYAYLGEDLLELVPVAGLDALTILAQQSIEAFADAHLDAWVSWNGLTAEFTPNHHAAVA